MVVRCSLLVCSVVACSFADDVANAGVLKKKKKTRGMSDIPFDSVGVGVGWGYCAGVEVAQGRAAYLVMPDIEVMEGGCESRVVA